MRVRVSWGWCRKWAGNLALLGASTLVVLLLAEVAVRLLAPQQLIIKRPDMWVAVDTLGWVHRANLRATVNMGEATVTLITDDHGYRVGNHPPDSGPRILLLGDSFMEALQVEYEQSLAGYIEDSLPKHLGRPVRVSNTAVGGWDPDQYLIQARRAFAGDDFDLVLVALYLGNDIISYDRRVVPPRAPVEVHRLRIPRHLSIRDFVNAWLYPINDALEVRSHLFILFKSSLSTVLMKAGLTATYFPHYFMKHDVDAPAWGNTASLCARIRALADQHHVPVLFVLIPTSFQVYPRVFDQYVAGFGFDPDSVDLDLPNRMMNAALDSLEIPHVDVTPALRAAGSSGMRLYGNVDRHFTAAGHWATFTAISDSLTSALARTTNEDGG